MLLVPLEERRRIATEAIIADPTMSGRRISREFGVSREMAARIRAKLERDGTIPSGLTLVGYDGKGYRVFIPTRHSFGLATITAKVKRMAKVVDGDAWHSADPRARRLLWLAAVNLAEAIGERIDVNTGCRIAGKGGNM